MPQPTQPPKPFKLAADLVNLLEGQLKTPSSKRASVVEQVRELLAKGADPNHHPAQLSSLAYALLLHDTSTALVLLEGGADPDAPVASKGLRMAGISSAQESAIKDNMCPLHLCTSLSLPPPATPLPAPTPIESTPHLRPGLMNKEILVEASRMLLEGRAHSAPGAAALNYALGELASPLGTGRVDNATAVSAAALRAAFSFESLPLVKTILGKLVSFEQLTRRDRWGRTALHLSVLSHNIPAAQALLERWDALGPETPSRCALLAVSKGAGNGTAPPPKPFSTSSQLVAPPAQSQAVDSLQRTAEHIAAQRRDMAFLDFLTRAADQRDCSAIHQQPDATGKLAVDYTDSTSRRRTAPRRVAGNEYESSGGWSSASVPPFGGGNAGETDEPDANADADRCDFDVVDASEMTPRDFLLEYLTSSTPVLLRGAANGWDMRRKQTWSKAEFMRRFASTKAFSARIPYARSFGEAAEATTIHDFLLDGGESDMCKFSPPSPTVSSCRLLCTTRASLLPNHRPQRARTDLSLTHHRHFASKDVFSDRLSPRMLDDFPIQPEWLKLDGLVDPMPIAIQYYVGPPGSGAPAHWHCDAWNALAYGRKRWFLNDPTQAMFSKQPVGEFARAGAASNLSQCVQHAGDVMFVPCGWGHAVLNEAESVGVAVELRAEFNLFV